MSELLTQINKLEQRNVTLERRLAMRDARIASLTRQVDNLLRRNGQETPQTFAIHKIEILNISGGTDLDGVPGDDAVAVYVQPRDQDGDVLKRGGRIQVKLFDLTKAGQPRLLAEKAIENRDEIRRAWFGKFWTHYYKVVTKLPQDPKLVPGQEIDVKVWFTDISTGREFTARKTVKIHPVASDEHAGADRGQ